MFWAHREVRSCTLSKQTLKDCASIFDTSGVIVTEAKYTFEKTFKFTFFKWGRVLGYKIKNTNERRFRDWMDGWMDDRQTTPFKLQPTSASIPIPLTLLLPIVCLPLLLECKHHRPEIIVHESPHLEQFLMYSGTHNIYAGWINGYFSGPGNILTVLNTFLYIITLSLFYWRENKDLEIK